MFFQRGRRAEDDFQSFDHFQGLGRYLALHPFFLSILIGVVLLKAVRVIVPEFPGMDHYFELSLMVLRFVFYACSIAFLFPYWLYFAIRRNVPFYFAHVAHFTFLHSLGFAVTHFVFYKYAYEDGLVHFLRQELFNLILSVPYVLYFKAEINRRLAGPGHRIPIWLPIRAPAARAAFEDVHAPEQTADLETPRPDFEWIADALTIQAQNQYVIVRMESGSQMVRMTMKDAIAHVDQKQGVRIHRSWWIRKNLIKSIQRDGANFKVAAINGEIYPLSKSNLDEVQSIIALNSRVEISDTI